MKLFEIFRSSNRWKTTRWYSSWVLVLSFIPLVVMYSICSPHGLLYELYFKPKIRFRRSITRCAIIWLGAAYIYKHCKVENSFFSVFLLCEQFIFWLDRSNFNSVCVSEKFLQFTKNIGFEPRPKWKNFESPYKSEGKVVYPPSGYNFRETYLTQRISL